MGAVTFTTGGNRVHSRDGLYIHCHYKLAQCQAAQ